LIASTAVAMLAYPVVTTMRMPAPAILSREISVRPDGPGMRRSRTT
jgi:hypothetical protein